MRLENRSMNWLPKPSAWDYQQSLNAKRRGQAQAYLNQQNLLATSIFSVKDTFNHDMTALVLQSVVKRIGTEAEQRAKTALPDDLLSKLKTEIDKTA